MATTAYDTATGEDLTYITDALDSPSVLEAILRSQHTHRLDQLASPAEICETMRELDDAAFEAMAEGQWSEKWFYAFSGEGGATVVGISAPGARELRRLRGSQGFPISIRPGDIQISEVSENGQKGIRVVGSGRCVRSGNEAVSSAFYPHMALAKGQKEPAGKRFFDKFAGRKALGATERNIIVALVPRAVVMRLLTDPKARAERNAPRLKAESRAHAKAATQPSAAVSVDPYGDEARAAAAAAPVRTPQEGDVIPDGTGDPKVVGEPDCPKCGGRMWDNRATKKNSKAPNFKCRDTSCGGVIWPAKAGA